MAMPPTKGTVPWCALRPCGRSSSPVACEIGISSLVKAKLSSATPASDGYDNGVFKGYTPYATSLNVTLSTIDEAISFNAFHEGIHLGYILAMKNKWNQD